MVARTGTPGSEPVAAVAAGQDGVLTTAQAVGLLGWSAVRWLVRSGRWQRPARGVLVTHNGPIVARQRVWVDLLRSGSDAVVAGVTAATLDGLCGYPEECTHVVLPPGRKLADRTGIVVHRSVFLGPLDVHPTRLPRRTRLARSLVDAARWSADERAACGLLAAGVQQRLVRPEQLHEVLERTPTARYHSLLLRTLADVAGGAHSLAEVDLLVVCRRFRLPLPEQQVPRYDALGRRRWLDAYWPEWRLHVEIDGSAHQEVRSWWDDLDRQNLLWISGDRVLRFPAYLVRTRPDLVANRIQQALEAAGCPARAPKRATGRGSCRW